MCHITTATRYRHARYVPRRRRPLRTVPHGRGSLLRAEGADVPQEQAVGTGKVVRRRKYTLHVHPLQTEGQIPLQTDRVLPMRADNQVPKAGSTRSNLRGSRAYGADGLLHAVALCRPSSTRGLRNGATQQVTGRHTQAVDRTDSGHQKHAHGPQPWRDHRHDTVVQRVRDQP